MVDRVNLRNLEVSEALKEGQNLFDQAPFLSAVDRTLQKYPFSSEEAGKIAVRTAIAETGHLICRDLVSSFELYDLPLAEAASMLAVEAQHMNNTDLHGFINNSWLRSQSSRDLTNLRGNGLKIFHQLIDELNETQSAFVYVYSLTGANKPFTKAGEPSKIYRQNKKEPTPTYEVWSAYHNNIVKRP